jgi:beta-mannosidase
MKKFFYLFLLLMAGTSLHSQTVARFQPHLDWKFRQFENANWYPAKVPGCVHTDLIANQVIAHPFYGTNETDCQWVGEKDWLYETSPFELTDSLLRRDALVLRFNGLDTYANVYLNDELILQADNAHRSWEVNVKKLLRTKGNVIRIHFLSPFPIAEASVKALPYPLPGDPIRAVTRKPQFHYGWDWGPKLVTCGISKSVELIAYDVARFNDVYVEQVKVTEKLAELKVTFIVQAVDESDGVLTVDLAQGEDLWSTAVHLRKGMNRIEFPLEIPFPYRWWCNGQGTPNLYTFNMALLHDGRTADVRIVSTGLRSVELITEKDSIGESFYFKLNDRPVFIKGANYIPMTYFPGEATQDDYRRLLTSCKNANINMLRVWGGGVYEDEIFYDLCDELGIMVWQDFMFACSMYPADSMFVANVIEEANEQTTRLRNHPCIALWCGNNENAEGWEKWGWQQGLSEKQKGQIWRAYKDVFDLTLGKIVKKNTNTDYWESSPRFGRSDPRSLTEGDSHYWGLWHDEEPFEVMMSKIPRFMSEYGMQSFPSDVVVKEMMSGDLPGYDNAGVKQHQKHNRGFALMDKYMERWYPRISHTDFSAYGYQTQVVQAEGIGMAVEAQRRSMPRCMGTMYWQLNDLWPSFSWSGIDYKGTPKLLHYFLSTIYAPQLISSVVENGTLNIYWISDNMIPEDSMLLSYEILEIGKAGTSDSTIYASPSRQVLLKNGVTVIETVALTSVIAERKPEGLVVSVSLKKWAAWPDSYSRKQKLVPHSSQDPVIPIINTRYIEDRISGKKNPVHSIDYFRRE